MQIATSCALPLGMAFSGPFAYIIPIQVILGGAGVAVLGTSLAVWRSGILG